MGEGDEVAPVLGVFESEMGSEVSVVEVHPTLREVGNNTVEVDS